MRRYLIWGALFLLGTALGGYFGISAYMATFLSRVPRIPLQLTPDVFGLTYEEVAFPSAVDRLTLKGWIIRGETKGPWIIMVHGNGSHRADPSLNTLSLVRDLARKGFNLLLFDLRAHGESEGERVSAGYYERRDLLGAIQFLVELGVAKEKIGLLGFSLGGAVSLLVASLEPKIGGVVADSSFADLGDLIQQEVAKRSRLPSIFQPGMLFMTRLLHGFDPRAVKPVEAIAAIKKPVLLIHGGADKTVPISHAQRLHRAAGNAQSELWIIPEAGHLEAYKLAPQEYVARITAYFFSQLDHP